MDIKSHCRLHENQIFTKNIYRTESNSCEEKNRQDFYWKTTHDVHHSVRDLVDVYVQLGG